MKDVDYTKEAMDMTEKTVVLTRSERRTATKINKLLYGLLGSFYTKIGEKQLSESEIRALFTKYDSKWRRICDNNKLKGEARTLFAQEIKTTWEKKDKASKE